MKTYRSIWKGLSASLIIGPAMVLLAGASLLRLPPADTSFAAEPRAGWSPPRFEEEQAARDRMVSVIRSYGLKDPATAGRAVFILLPKPSSPSQPSTAP